MLSRNALIHVHQSFYPKKHLSERVWFSSVNFRALFNFKQDKSLLFWYWCYESLTTAQIYDHYLSVFAQLL